MFISTNFFIDDQLLWLCTTQWKESEICSYIDFWMILGFKFQLSSLLNK